MLHGLVTTLLFDHQPVYVVTAALVCGMGMMLSMRLLRKVGKTDLAQQPYWLGLFAILFGATAWTTHFIAILGYRPDLLVGHDQARTIQSFLVATVGAALAGRIATSDLMRYGPEFGGFILGLSVGVMHFLGMAGFMLSCSYSLPLATSLSALAVICIGGAAACSMTLRLPGCPCKYGALIVGLATVVLHFGSMGSIQLDFGAPIERLGEYFPTGGLIMPIMLSIVVILSIGLVSLQIDRLSRRSNEEDAARLSQEDTLTGLPNRVGFRNHLELTTSPNSERDQFLLIAVDLDDFKHINDIYSHAAGDFVLQETARRIKEWLPSNGFVARTGGNEFYVVLIGAKSEDEAVWIGQDLCAALSMPVKWDHADIRIRTRIGMAMYPDHADTLSTLVAGVQIALYDAKSKRSQPVSLYDPQLAEEHRDRRRLAEDLIRDFEERRLTLFFQPQLDLRSGQIVGFEALLRWFHRERGAISPEIFIPIAEERGLIQSIGAWVLRTAICEAASWRRPTRIAINVAAAQFESWTLPGTLREVLQETGFSAQLVELEITESMVIEDVEMVQRQISELKSIGVKLAMDDYGTGYSALSTLLALPFDKIKFDKSFIQGLHQDPRILGVLKSTVELGKNLEISVLVEGVEDDAQLQILKEIGCDEVQGYLVGRPVSGLEARRVFGLDLSDVELWDRDLQADRTAQLREEIASRRA